MFLALQGGVGEERENARQSPIGATGDTKEEEEEEEEEEGEKDEKPLDAGESEYILTIQWNL